MFDSLQPPDVPLDVLQAFALRHYGLKGSWKRLNGERDQNYLVAEESGASWLFKVCNPHEGFAIAECQVAALEHISKTDHELPVPQVRRTLDGQPLIHLAWRETEYCGMLLSYLEGETFPEEPVPSELLYQMGQIVARLGKSLRGFVHPAPAARQLAWDHRQAPKLLTQVSLLSLGSQAKAHDILTRFISETMPQLGRLRAQIIHGDVHPQNSLLKEGKISGIIDFGDMIHGALVQDVSNLIADFIEPGADNRNIMFELVRGYCSITPLEEEEVAVLLPLIQVRLLMTPIILKMRTAGDATQVSYQHLEQRCFPLIDEIENTCAALIHVLRRGAALSPPRPQAVATVPELLKRRQSLMGKRPYLFYDQPLHIIEGKGMWLTASDGRKYLDCYNNVAHVGHCHPYVTEAISRQARTLNTNTRYLTDQAMDYAERITATLDKSLSAVIYVNSGSEANDVAWRMAKAWTGKSGGIAMEFAYHGITDAIDYFSPSNWLADWVAPHIRLLPPPDDYRGPYKRGEANLAERYAALGALKISELAQSSYGVAAGMVDSAFMTNGMLEAPAGYMANIVNKLRAEGGLFIADEVQSGFGRMGTAMWGHQHHGVVPDFVTLGKPSGNGHPIGVVITRPEILDHFTKSAPFFSTFGGNNVSCAAGLAVLDVMADEDLIGNARSTGEYFKSLLFALKRKHPIIGDVRGTGLALGIELVRDPGTLEPASKETKKLINLVRDEGVLIGSEGVHGNILKVRPPIVISNENVEYAAAAIDQALTNLTA
jgi:4-aminobutyrate aminotransferase-like enzyme/aminoglycoside phosphotransferase (APT) family kinase protein